MAVGITYMARDLAEGGAYGSNSMWEKRIHAKGRFYNDEGA